MNKRILCVLVAMITPFLVILIASFALLGSFQKPSVALADREIHAQSGPPQKNFLPLISKSNGKSSHQMIQEAVQNGTISAETGLEYEVFSKYGDNRLPAEYVGDPSVEDPEGIDSSEVISRMVILSPEGKALIQPFLLPPSDPASWFYLTNQSAAPLQATSVITNWSTTIITINSQRSVKIWWHDPAYAPFASIISANINTIWDQVTQLMDTQPLTDTNYSSGNGGGPELDIYIVRMGSTKMGSFNSFPVAFDPMLGSPKHAGYVLINGFYNGKNLKETVAHELFHAFQAAYDTKDRHRLSSWWKEATATWAETQLYPTSTSYGGYAQAFIPFSGVPLDFEADSPPSPDLINHPYGAFLFPLYVTSKESSSSFVRQTFTSMKTKTTLKAIDDNLTGGFKTVWPKFVQYVWNKAPLDFFAKNYKVNSSVKYTDDGFFIQMAPTMDVQNPIDLDRLSFKFYYYDVNDPDFRTLAITNPLSTSNNGTLQIGVKINGVWSFRDLSNNPYVTYCLDLHAERVSEILLITSNSDYTPGAKHLVTTNPFELRLTNIGCYAYSLNMKVTESHSGLTWTWTTQSVMTATLYGYFPLNSDFSQDFVGTSSDKASYQAHANSFYHDSNSGTDYTCQGDYSWNGLIHTYIKILDPYNLNQKNLGSLDRQYWVQSGAYLLPKGIFTPVEADCQPYKPGYYLRSAYQYYPRFDLFTHPISGDVYELIGDTGLIQYQNRLNRNISQDGTYFAWDGDTDATYNVNYTFTPLREP